MHKFLGCVVASALFGMFSAPDLGQAKDVGGGVNLVNQPDQLTPDAVGLIATIQFLRASGMDKYVDAYGVHFYPQGNASPADRLASLERDFAECGSASSGGKPCWLTEWGLPVHTGKSCPVNDDNRVRIFSELRNDFSQLAQQRKLEGIFLYTWQGDFRSGENNPYAAFICGAVTKSGRLAIAPL